jgi:predicted AlkP superfamily pyrophosphatase or phosphodiesterase
MKSRIRPFPTITLALLATIAVGFAEANAAATAEGPLRPRLILQITVDQLRSDLPWRYYDRFGKGGFRYLMEEGTVYLNAHHRHANTETVVGHTTLATGADPAAHGMVANVWLDRGTGELAYNVEDPRYPILTAGAGVDKATEIDPTQRAARTDGRSPTAIQVSTVGDELKLFFGPEAKVFGVSVKDRGAIAMAGHTGKAFWFSKQRGEFITSRFYYDRYPDWVAEYNARRPADVYAGQSWVLLNDVDTYRFGAADDRPYETALPGFGRVFPHPFGQPGDRFYTTLLTVSPVGDEMTVAFAKALIDSEDIGTDDVPDYLSVSLSSTDYVGHVFGPSSLEAEDNLLRLDRALADLLGFVDDRIGLDQVLVVLSSDHGGPEAPGYLQELGFEADYIDPEAFDATAELAPLKERFGIGDELISIYFHPYLYLNREVITAQGLDQGEVEEAVAEVLSTFDGVALAVSSTALREGRVPNFPLVDSVLRNFSPTRSGDIYIVFEPNRFINDFDGLVVASTHGSPWRYDSHVPIVFAGAGVPAQRIARRVETVDVALTLALLIGAKAPSGAVGKPLDEVLESR